VESRAIHDAESEIRWELYAGASGPGGQNINRVATAVRLRFDIHNSKALPDDVKRRLERIAGRRVSTSGELVIEARRQRSQAANRRDAIHRFRQLLKEAMRPPKIRPPTAPPRAVHERRMLEKKRRSSVKRLRRRPAAWDD